MNTIVGIKYDGTMSICKATPEHRGKGSCKHFEHEELETNEITSYIKEHNEKTLQKRHEIFGTLKKKPSRKQRNKLLALDEMWNETELVKAANREEKNFQEIDHRLASDFYLKYSKLTNSTNDEENVNRINNFLQSDDEIAIKIRKYLEVEDASYLTHLIVRKPNSMSEQRWTSRGKVSAARCIMSKIDNDMTDEKYITSVLYFKGRCCYCDRVLDKTNPSVIATGEHLTPVSNESENTPPGATKYGNMTLCCNSCNSKRQDTNIVKWLAKTDMIKKSIKPYALARINAFRKFTNYREFTSSESKKINESIIEASDFIEQFRNDKETKGFIKGSSDIVNPKVEEIVQKLKKDLNIA